jgi:hypothetical protein
MSRHPLAYLAVALAVILLPGCARSVDGTPVVAKNSAGKPVTDYDISRLSTLQSEFPPGFDRVQAMPVATLGPAADKFSNIGIGDVVNVDPPNCRSMLQPVRPPRDAQFTMVAGIGGEGAIMVGAVKSSDPLPETTAPAGCDHAVVTQKISRRQVKSTVTRLPGPAIDGVTTTGSMDVGVLGGIKSYVFTGSLSDRVAVAVQGLLPGSPHAEDILQDLLVKAVNAIREG